MAINLLFDFEVDKENTTVLIKREFAAPQNLVWDAWTKAEILDQWWGPSPFIAKTKTMDFTVGGYRLYAMISPDGVERWSKQEYTSITPITNYKLNSSFTDENGNIDKDFPTSKWSLTFSEENNITTVSMTIKHEKLEYIELHIKMGFKEGFTQILEQLDTYFLNLK